MKPKVICIVGPTGVGKTSLAFKLAKNINGALVSADSVQVYKGLDIVSGKDLPKTSKFVSLPQLSNNEFNTGYFIHKDIGIFLLDIVEPTFSFSVSQFQKLATKSIDYIISQGRLPIIVGGTGLYIEVLLNGLDELPGPDFELRKKLSSLDVSDLQKLLPENELLKLNDSDRNNSRRLIRKIETLKNKSQIKNLKSKIEYDSLVIGLECERQVLKQRINIRVMERLRQGALDEAKKLFQNYDHLVEQVKNANGYKQLFMFLKNELSYEEAIERWKISEYRHAKNQMTWFRKYGNVKWFDITKKEFYNNIENKIKNFLKEIL